MSSEISNLTEWMQKALAFGQQRNEEEVWPQIKMGSEQHKSWILYFRDLGLPLPVALELIHMNKQQTWTAPCEWPHEQNFSVKGIPPPENPFEKQAKRCYRVLKTLAFNILDNKSRFSLLKYPVAVRKRAMEMFKPDEPKPALTIMEYQDKSGRIVTSGEPFFLPKSNDVPPGGPGGKITFEDDSDLRDSRWEGQRWKNDD